MINRVNILIILCVLLNTKLLSDNNWELKSIDTGNNLITNVFFVDNTTGWIVGYDRTILNTTDGGETWMFQSTPVSWRADVNGLYFLDSSTGWVGLQGGIILHTNNGGLDWIEQEDLGYNSILSIYFSDQDNGWAVGSRGTVLRTQDGGENWELIAMGAYVHYYEIYFFNENQGIIIDSNGMVHLSDDGGKTWESRSTGTSHDLHGLHFINDDVGWVVGRYGTILKTTNGGKSWAQQTSNTQEHLWDIKFVDENKGWAVGTSGTILFTSDGGVTWSDIPSGVLGHLYALDIKDGVGWAVGWTGIVLRNMSIPPPPLLSSPSDNEFEVPTNPTLRWNESKGATSYQFQVSSNSIFSNIIIDQDNVTSTSHQVTGLSEGTTYYWRVNASNSAGTSDWSSVRSFTTKLSIPDAPVLSSPADGATGIDTDPLLNWEEMTGAESYRLQVSINDDFTDLEYNQGNISATSRQVIGLSEGTRYYWRVNATNSEGTGNWSEEWSFTTEGATSVTRMNGNVPTQHTLKQNYPNPFNPSTTIRYGIPERSYVQLSVYDGLGRLITILVSDDQSAGYYEVTFKSKDIPSGVYIYRLQAGEYVESRRMLYLR